MMSFKEMLLDHINQCLQEAESMRRMLEPDASLDDADISYGIWALRLEKQSADDFFTYATNARDWEIVIEGTEDETPMRDEFNSLLQDCIATRLQELNSLKRLLDPAAFVNVQRVEKACMILKLNDAEADALHVAAIRAQYHETA